VISHALFVSNVIVIVMRTLSLPFTGPFI
jgi:hypothetical protein